MKIKILGKDTGEVLAEYMCRNGWFLDKFDQRTNTLFCRTKRRGRTDEDIDREAREARVAFAIVMTFYTGMFICPSFKYRVLE